MVLGNSSRFTEGFTSFTPDDELMIANLKQALVYSKEKVAIPDHTLNVDSSSTKSEAMPENTRSMSNGPSMNNKPQQPMNPNPPMMNSNKNMMPINPMPPMPPMNESKMSIPTMSLLPTIANKPIMSAMPTMAAKPAMSATMPTIANKPAMSATMPTMVAKPAMSAMPTMGSEATMSTKNSSVSKFKDIKRVMNNGDEDSDEEEDVNAVLEEEDETNVFEEEAEEKKKHSKTRRDHFSVEEGFRGSLEIQSRNLRNILLALLLSCIGYLVVYSMTNNFIPIDDISPQLKKFKRIIYAGLFFLITYVCLEIF